MSLEQPGTSKKVRTRNQRNRPRLVTEPIEGPGTDTLAPDTEHLAVDVPETTAATEPVSAPKQRRRLPGFFSTVGKNDQENKAKEAEVAQARLARATRGKIAQPEKAASAKNTETKTTRTTTTTRTTAQPTGLFGAFKARHIIGFALYLIGANYIGLLEKAFLGNMGLDRLLATFNLLGAPVTITTSTLLFLATLVILLVILAKLDLIPRSLTGMGTKPTPPPSTRTKAQPREQTPQAVTPGDKLYQEYKASQRREKKR